MKTSVKMRQNEGKTVAAPLIMRSEAWDSLRARALPEVPRSSGSVGWLGLGCAFPAEPRRVPVLPYNRPIGRFFYGVGLDRP